VVGHEVEQDPDISTMGLGDELVEISHRPEDRIDLTVISDVVAEVGHGGDEDRREPNGVDSQPLQIVESAGDASEVPDAIPVRVLVRTRVDLVDDG
jgi:hypothetical protein